MQGETCKYQCQGKRKWRVGEWLVAGALLLPESWHPASTSISVREDDDPRVGREEVLCFCKQHSSSTWTKIADVNKETRSLYCSSFVLCHLDSSRYYCIVNTDNVSLYDLEESFNRVYFAVAKFPFPFVCPRCPIRRPAKQATIRKFHMRPEGQLGLLTCESWPRG